MSCCAQNADLCWTRGDTGLLAVEVADDDGAPLDLTGGTLFLTVKNAVGDADEAAVLRKEVTQHSDAAAGKSAFTLAAGDNATAGVRVYDIQLVDAEERVLTLVGGLWRVVSDVTTRTEPLPEPEPED
jgi:hypothetical protein